MNPQQSMNHPSRMTVDQYNKWRESLGKPGIDPESKINGVVDAFGNIIPTERLKAWGRLDDDNEFELMHGKPMHYGPSGNITSKMESSIDLDEETGDITITAPDFVFDRDGIENLETDLKALSQSYKIDPDAKLPLVDGKDATVKDIIQDLNDPNKPGGIQKYVDAAQVMHMQEYGVPGQGIVGDRETYDISDDVKLSDKYFAIRNTVAMGDDVRDDTLQAISQLPAVKKLFENLATYKETDGVATAQYKDIMEHGWTRIEHSDQDIQEARDQLEYYFAHVHVRSEEDSIELAHNIATYEFITGKKPDVQWLRSVAETAGSFFTGIGNFFLDTTAYVGAGISSGIIAGHELTFKAMEDIVYNRTLEDNKSEWWDTYQNFVKSWELNRDEGKENRRFLSGTMAASEEIGYGLARLASLIYVGNVASASFSGALAGASQKAAAVANAVNVAGASTATAGTAAEALSGGLQMMVSLSSTKQVAGLAKFVSEVLADGGISFVASAVAETAGEVIVGQPKRFYEIISSGELSPEDSAVMWGEYLQNVIGGGAGLALGKGLLKFGESDLGRVTSHNMAILMQKGLTPMRELKTKYKLKLHGVDSVEEYVKKLRNAKDGKYTKNMKANAVAINDLLNTAKKQIAGLDYIRYGEDSHEEMMKLLNKSEEIFHQIRSLNNAIDSMGRGGLPKLITWYSSNKYRAFRGASGSMEDAYEVVRKAEDDSNFRINSRPGNLAISQDTTNYIFNKNIQSYYQNQVDLFPEGEHIKKYKEALHVVTEEVDEYVANAPEGVVAAADEFIKKQRAWNREAVNLLVKENLLNGKQIEELRASGLWGEDGELYVHAVRNREKDSMYTTTIDVVRKDMVSDPYSYVTGTDKDFLDPLTTARQYMLMNADNAARQDFAKVYMAIKGTTDEVVVDAKSTELVRKVNGEVERKANAEIEAIVKDVADSFRASGVTTGFVTNSRLRDSLYKIRHKVKLAEKDVASAKKKPLSDYKASPQARVKAVSTMTTDETNNLWNKIFKNETTNAIDYTVENYSNLPKQARDFILRRIEEYRSTTKGSIEFAELNEGPFEYNGIQYGDIDDFLASSDFRNASKTETYNILKKIFGKDDADRIMERAKEYAAGATNADDMKDLSETVYRTEEPEVIDDGTESYELAKAKYDEDYAKYKADKKEIERFQELQDIPGSQFTEADNAIDAKWGDYTDEQLEEILANPPKKPVKSEMVRGGSDSYEAAKAKYDEEYAKYKADKKEIKRFQELQDIPGSQFTEADNAIDAKWGDYTDEQLEEILANPPKKPLKSEYKKAEPKKKVEPEKTAPASEPKTVTVRKQPTNDDIRYAVADMRYSDELDLRESTVKAQQEAIPSGVPTKQELEELAEYDPDFDHQLKQVLISYYRPLRDNPVLDSIALTYNRTNDRIRRDIKLKTRSEELDKLAKDFGVSSEEICKIIDAEVDRIEEMILSRPSLSRKIDALVEYHDGDEALKVYLGERILAEHMDDLKAKIVESLKKELEDQVYGVTNPNEAKKIAKRFAAEVEDRIRSRVQTHGEALSNVYPWTNNYYKVYGEVEHEAAKIKGFKSDTDAVVIIKNADGQTVLHKTDPLVASMLRHDVLPKPMDWKQRVNYLLSKMFRLGTVGINIRSMVNQTFRDFGNAFVGGNFYRMWAQNVDQMRDVLGDNVVEWIKACDSELAQSITDFATETGQKAEDVAYDFIKKTGESMSPQATETAAYKRSAMVAKSVKAGKIKGGVEEFNETSFTKVGEFFNKAEDKLGKLNEKREVFLRNGVYRNAFTDAVKRGYSYADAQDYAVFAMNNATTNFSRLTEHFTNMQQSIPFLGAAINGTKSFYRLLELDPAGVLGRMVGGIALPAISLTVYSLSDEQNREVYKNIPEYQKEDNILFVVGGQIVTIPIPQEISSVIAPFRHLVEKMYESNEHAFWQLAANDVVGFSPIDLSGFVNIDANTLMEGTSEDGGLIDNIDTGLCKLAAQLLPPYMKSAVMYATGIDPYTMNKIDRDNYVTDIDREQAIIMDDYSSEFSKGVARILNNSNLPDMFKISAPMAEKMLGGIIGSAPVKYLGWMIELGQDVVDGDGLSANNLGNIVQSVGEFAGGPLYVDPNAKSIATRDWNEAVSRLYQRREELLNSKAYKEYHEKYLNAHTPEAHEALRPVYENLVADYYKDIQKTVTNLQTKYPTEYTAAKHASVLNLSTLDLSASAATPVSKQLDDKQFKTARTMAINTMAKMGFDSPSDYSVFGYYRYYADSDEVSMVASTPMAILNLDRVISGASDLHGANILSLLSDNELETWGDGYNELRAKEDEFFNKPYEERTEEEYDEMDRLREEWNAVVMEKLYPYISRYGINEVLKSDEVTNRLSKIIRVPDWYKVDKRGRHVSIPRANKQKAFATQYIKDFYRAMDEGRN